MPADDGDARTLHVSARSVALVIAGVGIALVVRNVFNRSTRVLGWLAAATVVAALVHPAVEALSRWVRRGVALLVVLLLLTSAVGYVAYAVVDDVRGEIARLQQVAPEAAQRIEDSDRYGQATRDFRLRERVEEFVDELPRRLAGGSTAQVIRSATTRGLAYLAGAVLTLFLVLHGPRIIGGGLRQIGDDAPRRRAEHVAREAYRRASTYLLGTFAIAAVSGVYTYVWCRFASLPGATVLGLLAALFSVIPYVGMTVGVLPVLLLTAGLKPSSPWIVVLLVAFVAWQLLDGAVLRRRLHVRSISIGPVITTLVGMLGLDLYGIGGALVGVAYAVFLVAVIDELAPTDADTVNLGAITP